MDATPAASPLPASDSPAGGFHFSVTGPACGPRVGCLTTPRGAIATPVFMPVGTRATVKAMLPGELEELGASIILANTFHLHLRPGERTIQRAGGLHRFMNWRRPILTDSGGFQVFSLTELRKLTEEGVAFRSPVDGARIFLSPESATRIQRALGADIIMAFDECPPPEADALYCQKSMDLTLRWLERCFREFHAISATGTVGDLPLPSPVQALFPIVQGGIHPGLRRSSAQLTLQAVPTAVGYAIGGLSVGESKEAMAECLEASIEGLPADRPRYMMGVGTPVDFVEAVTRGVDMFDCVLPTRNARNGRIYTREGIINIKNSRFRDDFGPLSPSCACPTCTGYSRAYLNHLYLANEILSSRLLTGHQLFFFIEFMERLRAAIAEGTFESFRRETHALYGSPTGSKE